MPQVVQDVTDPATQREMVTFNWPFSMAQGGVDSAYSLTATATYTLNANELGTAIIAQVVVESDAPNSGAPGAIYGGTLAKLSNVDAFGVCGVINVDDNASPQHGTGLWGIVRGNLDNVGDLDGARISSEVYTENTHPNRGLLIYNHSSNWFDTGIRIQAAESYGYVVGPHTDGTYTSCHNPTYPFAYERYTGGTRARDFFVNVNGCVNVTFNTNGLAEAFKAKNGDAGANSCVAAGFYNDSASGGAIVGVAGTNYTQIGILQNRAFINANGALAGLAFNCEYSGDIVFGTQNTKRIRVPNAGGFVVGNGALATNSTAGFLYIPSCSGAPTGTPATETGTVPLVYDTANNRIYAYNGGWKKIGLA